MNAVIKENIVFGIAGCFIGVFVLMTLGIEDAVYLGLSFINCVICVCSLFSYRDKPFSTFKINHIFILFFFVLANAVQYAEGSVVSSLDVILTPAEYRWFQFLVLIILILYNYLYSRFEKGSKRIRVRSSFGDRYSSNRLLLVALLATVIVVLKYRNNPLHLVLRGIEGSGGGGGGGGVMSALLFSKILRPLPFACYIIAKVQKKKLGIRVCLLFLMLVSLFPTSLARNAVVMYWLPVALLAVPFLKKPNVFIIIMLVGLLVLFPFFDNFRYYNGSVSFGFNFNYLNTMNFDAGQNFMITMKFQLITFGRQLMGALLFFVPRKIWPTKPIGSGATLAAEQDAFSNISMPYFGEGYINFGLLGIFLFTVFLAFITAYLDRNYWKSGDPRVKTWFTPYYLVFVGAALFIMRGDMMSSFAYTFATLFDVWIVMKITRLRRKMPSVSR